MAGEGKKAGREGELPRPALGPGVNINRGLLHRPIPFSCFTDIISFRNDLKCLEKDQSKFRFSSRGVCDFKTIQGSTAS